MTMSLIPFMARLDTGARVRIREVDHTDRALLLAGFDQLSDRSRYMRFLTVHPELTEAELILFTAPADSRHAAIGAELQGDGTIEPLGIARYVRLGSETDDTQSNVAEIALTVVDSAQGLGLGRILLGALTRHATQNGIDEFVALVHGENTAMQALMRHLGALEVSRDGGQIEMRVPLTSGPLTGGQGLHDGFTDAFRAAKMR